MSIDLIDVLCVLFRERLYDFNLFPEFLKGIILLVEPGFIVLIIGIEDLDG